MQRTQLIFHLGRQIILQDFSNTQSAEEALQAIADARAFSQQHAEKNALLLTIVANSYYNKEVLKALRDLIEYHKSYVAASAVVGLSPLARITYSAINRVTGGNIRAFDNVESAKDWLVKQGQST